MELVGICNGIVILYSKRLGCGEVLKGELCTFEERYVIAGIERLYT